MNVKFGVCLVNAKNIFDTLSELIIAVSKLFHSFVDEGKKVFLKKLCLALHKGILSHFLVLYDLEGKSSVKEYFKVELKGHLRYKTITSQNVSSEAQIKNFFIS